MKASLKRLHSPDVYNLEDFTPSDPDDFAFLLQAFFGSDDGPGDESFDIMVSTPRWLEYEVREHNGILMGRHYLIIDHYNFGRLKRFLVDYAEKCTG